jgi:hypothetical protein
MLEGRWKMSKNILVTIPYIVRLYVNIKQTCHDFITDIPTTGGKI